VCGVAMECQLFAWFVQLLRLTSDDVKSSSHDVKSSSAADNSDNMAATGGVDQQALTSTPLTDTADTADTTDTTATDAVSGDDVVARNLEKRQLVTLHATQYITSGCDDPLLIHICLHSIDH